MLKSIIWPKKHNGHSNDSNDHKIQDICDSMSFTAAESYKMLRTKIDLILPRDELSYSESGETVQDQYPCKVIGITSALRGEGKSTTAINLAYTLAETGRKVCLLEADMRLPSIGKRLSLNLTPGLSNLLTGQIKGSESIQKYKSQKGIEISVITAGDVPPMPAELLESQNMRIILKTVRKEYDYVIIDLPPVTIVADALAISPNLDGILLVVRQDYCDRISLQNAMAQFELSGTKILGTVLNCSRDVVGSGSGSYYYKKRR